MEITNKIGTAIDEVFDIICIICDENELNFDSGEVLVQKFRNALEWVATINAKEVAMEIWNATSKEDRKNEIDQLIHLYFIKLIEWKPDAKEIKLLNYELPNDLILFFQKQTLINRSYSSLEKNQIEKFYIAICHRLLKANQDMHKVYSKLTKMAEDEFDNEHEDEFENEASNFESDELLLANSSNIKINSEKQAQFISIISGLYDENYFIPVDSSIPISLVDILNKFGVFLKNDLISDQNDVITPATPEQIVKPEGQKSFSDYLLHINREKLADETRKEFSKDKGKAIRLLIEVMQRNNPPLIAIGYRQAKDVYKAMCDHSNWEIGTYQSVFNYKIDLKYDQKDLNNTTARLNHILSSLEK